MGVTRHVRVHTPLPVVVYTSSEWSPGQLPRHFVHLCSLGQQASYTLVASGGVDSCPVILSTGSCLLVVDLNSGDEWSPGQPVRQYVHLNYFWARARLTEFASRALDGPPANLRTCNKWGLDASTGLTV